MKLSGLRPEFAISPVEGQVRPALRWSVALALVQLGPSLTEPWVPFKGLL